MLLESSAEPIWGGLELFDESKNVLRIFLGMFKVLQFLGFWVYRKILLDLFPELIRGGPELSTELLHLTKNSLRNYLGISKALQFLRFWVYRKISRDFFIELISAFFVELIRGGTELSTELLDLKKKIPSKFFGYV